MLSEKEIMAWLDWRDPKRDSVHMRECAAIYVVSKPIVIGIVYGLASDVDGFRYVGTTQRPGERLRGHLNRVRKVSDHSELVEWFRLSGTQNIKMITLEECFSVEEMIFKERKWIGKMLSDGFELFNKQIDSHYQQEAIVRKRNIHRRFIRTRGE